MYMNAPGSQDKSMDEILASIRQTITEDLGTMTESPNTSQDITVAAPLADDVLELTQIVQDDGTIIDLREEQPMNTTPSVEGNLEAALVSEPIAVQNVSESPENITESPLVLDSPVEDADAGSKEQTVSSEENASEKIEATNVPFNNLVEESPDITAAASSEPIENKDIPQLEANVAPSTPQTPVSSGFGEPIMDTSTIRESLAALSALSSFTSTQQGEGNNLSTGTQTIDGLVRELLRPMLKEWLDANLPSLVKWVVTEQVEQIFKERGK